jgi:PKD repeat protein
MAGRLCHLLFSFIFVSINQFHMHCLRPFVFFTILITLAGTIGCKKTPAPATCFATVPDSAYVGQLLTFSSCTQGASSYYWDFGDNGYSTFPNATHTYTAPGIYHGGLTTSNGTGEKKTFIIVVTRPYSIWTFKGSTDTSTYALTVGGDTLQTTNFSAANTANVSNILVIFSALPTVSGSYQVINDQFGGTPGSSQAAVFLTTPSGRNYGSTGNDHTTVNVTVTGGKIRLSIPAVEMVNVSQPSDSSSLSATIIQTE